MNAGYIDTNRATAKALRSAVGNRWACGEHAAEYFITSQESANEELVGWVRNHVPHYQSWETWGNLGNLGTDGWSEPLK